MRGRRVVWLAIAFAPALSACSALVGFDGFVGNASDASDASNDATTKDGSASDASIDATSIDAPSSTDAGVLDASRYCATLAPAPYFCADFDELGTDPVVEGGTYFNVGPAGVASYSLVTSPVVSPPRALSVSTTTGFSDSNNGRYGAMELPTNITPQKRASVSMQVHLDTIDEVAYALIAQLIFLRTSDNASYTLSLYVAQPGIGSSLQLGFPVDGGSYSYPSQQLSVSPKMGDWSTVVMLADFENNLVTITIDGVNAGTAAIYPNGFAGTVTFTTGLKYYAGTNVAASTAEYDNVVFDLE